jgi:hypothetical protein
MNAILDMNEYIEDNGLLFHSLGQVVGEALDGEWGPMDQAYVDLMHAVNGDAGNEEAILNAAISLGRAFSLVEKRLQAETPNC